jgi:multimeric flavodoxin WrbA
MKVIAINGSPRKNGNTKMALEAVLEPLEAAGVKAEIINIGASGIKPCAACGGCYKNKNRRCVINNDIFNALLEPVWAADALIIASPTYFASLTPETKAFIDRLGYVSRANGGLLSRKIGASAAVMRRAGGMEVLNAINKLLLISDMVSVGSSYWNIAFGRNEGEVKDDKEGMATMARLGENILWLLQKTAV